MAERVQCRESGREGSVQGNGREGSVQGRGREGSVQREWQRGFSAGGMAEGVQWRLQVLCTCLPIAQGRDSSLSLSLEVGGQIEA